MVKVKPTFTRSTFIRDLIGKLDSKPETHGRIFSFSFKLEGILTKSIALRSARGLLEIVEKEGEEINAQNANLPSHSCKRGIGKHDASSNGISFVRKQSRTQGGEENVAKNVSQFFTTISLVAALLLTVTIPWLFTKIDSSDIVQLDEKIQFLQLFYNCSVRPCEARDLEIVYKEALNVSFVSCIFVSSIMSLLSLIFAVTLQIHLDVCMLTEENKLWFIENIAIKEPERFLKFAIIFLGFSIPLGIVVVYGRVVCWICAGIILLMFIKIRSFNTTLDRQEHDYMDPQYQEEAHKLRAILEHLESAAVARDRDGCSDEYVTGVLPVRN